MMVVVFNFERFVGVFWPLDHNIYMTSCRVRCIVIATLVGSFALAMPRVIEYELVEEATFDESYEVTFSTILPNDFIPNNLTVLPSLAHEYESKVFTSKARYTEDPTQSDHTSRQSRPTRSMKCQYTKSGTSFEAIMTGFQFLFNFIIPFTLLFAFNGSIIYKIRGRLQKAPESVHWMHGGKLNSMKTGDDKCGTAITTMGTASQKPKQIKKGKTKYELAVNSKEMQNEALVSKNNKWRLKTKAGSKFLFTSPLCQSSKPSPVNSNNIKNSVNTDKFSCSSRLQQKITYPVADICCLPEKAVQLEEIREHNDEAEKSHVDATLEQNDEEVSSLRRNASTKIGGGEGVDEKRQQTLRVMPRSSRLKSSTTRAMYILLTISFLFVALLTPRLITDLLYRYGPKSMNKNIWLRLCSRIGDFLYMLNSAINLIVYTIYLPAFRTFVKSIFRCSSPSAQRRKLSQLHSQAKNQQMLQIQHNGAHARHRRSLLKLTANAPTACNAMYPS